MIIISVWIMILCKWHAFVVSNLAHDLALKRDKAASSSSSSMGLNIRKPSPTAPEFADDLRHRQKASEEEEEED